MSNATATHTLHIDTAADEDLTAWQAISADLIDTDTAEAITDDQAYARNLIDTHVTDNGAGLGVDSYYRVRIVTNADGAEWISDTIWAAGEAHEDADDIAYDAYLEAPGGVEVSFVEYESGSRGRTITINDTVRIHVYNAIDEHGRPWAGYDLAVWEQADGRWINHSHDWVETADELRAALARMIANALS